MIKAIVVVVVVVYHTAIERLHFEALESAQGCIDMS